MNRTRASETQSTKRYPKWIVWAGCFGCAVFVALVALVIALPCFFKTKISTAQVEKEYADAIQALHRIAIDPERNDFFSHELGKEPLPLRKKEIVISYIRAGGVDRVITGGHLSVASTLSYHQPIPRPGKPVAFNVMIKLDDGRQLNILQYEKIITDRTGRRYTLMLLLDVAELPEFNP